MNIHKIAGPLTVRTHRVVMEARRRRGPDTGSLFKRAYDRNYRYNWYETAGNQ